MNESDVVNWARTVEADSANPAEIERMLLSEHPEIVQLIDASVAEASATAVTRNPASPAAGVTGLLMAVFALEGVLAPIAGVVLSLPESPVFTELSVAHTLMAVALCFTVSVIAVVGAFIVWLWRGAHRSAPLRALGVVAALGGGVSTALLPTLAAEDGVALTPWNIPGMVALAAGILTTAVVMLRWKSVSAVTAASARERLRVAVAALPADERRRMLRARTEALDVLVTRGILQHDSREQRRAMPLGDVAILDETLRARGA